jgi:hypothetical protein
MRWLSKLLLGLITLGMDFALVLSSIPFGIRGSELKSSRKPKKNSRLFFVRKLHNLPGCDFVEVCWIDGAQRTVEARESAWRGWGRG